jgi:hypothetical protein
MRKIEVLKTFTFTTGSAPMPREIVFEPGVHEVDDAIANHDWIRAGADGKVKLPPPTPAAKPTPKPTPTETTK